MKKVIKKPKGWRNIVVDGEAYWWRVCGNCPIVQRVKDRKKVDLWTHLVNRGFYNAMNDGDCQWTPKDIAEMIKLTFIN